MVRGWICHAAGRISREAVFAGAPATPNRPSTAPFRVTSWPDDRFSSYRRRRHQHTVASDRSINRSATAAAESRCIMLLIKTRPKTAPPGGSRATNGRRLHCNGNAVGSLAVVARNTGIPLDRPRWRGR